MRAWEKYGFDVNYDDHVSAKDAHGLVARSGSSAATMSRPRACAHGSGYVGQTMNVSKTQLVVRADSGMDGVMDLREKKVARTACTLASTIGCSSSSMVCCRPIFASARISNSRSRGAMMRLVRAMLEAMSGAGLSGPVRSRR